MKSWSRGLFGSLFVFAGIIIAGWSFCLQRTVHVQIRSDAPIPGGIQIYYTDNPKDGFSETKSIFVRQEGTPAVADAFIPVNKLARLRIDFGSAPGNFTILGGFVGTILLPPWKAWQFSSDVTLKSSLDDAESLMLFSDGIDPFMSVSFRRPIRSAWTVNRNRLVLALTLALAIALAAGRNLTRRSKGKNLEEGETRCSSRPFVVGLSVTELAFLLSCAVYYTSWIFQPFNFSPDEAMRFEVTRFLFEHGRLPINEEAIGGVWGVSYAHIPTMFCNVFGALFMKVGSLFSSDPTALLRAARMLSVACITGTVFWTIRAAKLLFKAPFHWLPVCIVAFLPQFAFIGSYVNNDSAALLGCSLILFAWVSAIQRRWNYGTATILSAGLAICATSYYNSYAWILISLLMFPLTYTVRNGRTGLIRMGLFVSAATFTLGGYLFLRHLYLYGDLLGFATVRRFAAVHAAAGFAPDVRTSLRDDGYSLPHMLFGLKWVLGSMMSFVGNFGYMQFLIPSWCYAAYAWILGIGVLGGIWKGVRWILNPRHIGICKWALLVSLLGCTTVTIGLSMYYSFTWDFQPQGRYCFPALLPIALLSAKGIEQIVDGTALRKIRGAVVFATGLLLGLVSEASYLFFLGLF